MKLIRKLSPKNLFGGGLKRDRSSISRSDPESFSSSGTSSSDASSSSTAQKPDYSGSGASVLPHTELYEAFKMIDKDGDGFVSRTELETVLTRIGPKPPTAEEISLMLSEVDEGGDGPVRLETLMNQVALAACEPAELQEVFDCFDEDGDGRITAEELLRFFLSIGNDGLTIEDCRRMIAGVDKKGDGFVCFEDFSRMMEVPICS